MTGVVWAGIPVTPADVVIVVAALLAVAGGIAWAVRRRRKGGCGGGCAGCPHAGACEEKENTRHGVDDDNGCGKGLR